MFAALVSILLVVGVSVSSALALEGKAGEVIRTVGELKELQAKGLLSRAQVIIYSDLVNNGISIPIVETTDRRVEVSAGRSYWRFTQMNKGKASIGPNDELVNYAGQGLPFPDVTPDDPRAAIKAAWNWEYKHQGDDSDNKFVYWLVDSKGNTKTLKGPFYSLSFTNRTDLDPRPNLLEKNPSGVRYKEVVGFTEPFGSKGLAQLIVKYEDVNRDRDVWVYVPGLRRTMRVGGANRCDCLGGFVHNMDDQLCFSGNVPAFTWKFLEEKEHFVATTGTVDKDSGMTLEHFPFTPGLHCLAIQLERRKVWLIEQKSKDPDYCYSKRIFYYDPTNGYFHRHESYDRAGNLWKSVAIYYSLLPFAGEGHVMSMDQSDSTDLKIWEGGPNHNLFKKNLGLKPDMFTLDYMRRAGR